jgi:hypothetical protein
MNAAAKTVSVLAAAIVTGAAPPAAAAATLTVNRPCYVNPEPSQSAPMVLTGAGFSPGDTVDVQGNGVNVTAPVNAAGGFSTQTGTPLLSTIDPVAQRFTLTATDDTASGARITASATVTVTNLAFAVQPAAASPTKKVTFTFAGFKPGRAIYAHYLHGRNVVASQRFGVADGPCGLLKVKAREFPGGRPRYHSYPVQFDSSRRYSAEAAPQITATLSFFRV